MTTLAVWLKKIVLLVLLATVLDLLLPNTELQRYVKLVMGLLILLVILSPVLTLFSPHLNAEWLAVQTAVSGPAMESASAIAEKGRALRQALDQRAMEEAESRMAELVRRQVEAAFGLAVDEVVVTWTREKEGGVSLASLTVTVRERREAAASRENDAEGGGRIEPVAPVDVRVADERDPIDSAARPANGRRFPEVEAYLAKVLAVDEDQVRVVAGSGRGRQAEAGGRAA
ncbi:MAG TPA: stage III sporulation protein AF [Calditerricola sp.]